MLIKRACLLPISGRIQSPANNPNGGLVGRSLMAVPNSERPSQGNSQSGRASAGNRPLAATGSSAAPQAAGHSNRPIPLQSRPDEVPEEAYEHDEEEHDDLREVLRNAPAWLVSTVFHTMILIVLGVWAAASQLRPVDVSLEVAQDEQFGTQLEDPSVLQGDSPTLENAAHATEQVITPRDLPPVDDPLAAPIELGDLKLATGLGLGPVLTGPTTIEGAPIGLALKGRQAGSKNVLLGKYGGTDITENAVERGLEWLAKQQKADGTWSLSGPYPDGSRSENVAAATAMALLAFQGHGDTHREGKYAKNVARAWSALLKMQRKDGLITGTMTESSQLLYTHAQCAIALCELYGMTQDSAFRNPAERAVAYCVASQDPQYGGWRYEFGKDSDTSVTGWFVMALQSARMAGLKVPEATLTKVSGYLDIAQWDGGRRYGYWQTANVSNAVTAEGLLCRQYLGWHQDDPRLVEGISALNKSPISYDAGMTHDVYYWYYATQATHHMEGKIWDEWNNVMRKEVPAHQVKGGAEAGSWSPLGDKWGAVNYGGGRLYVTCLSIYMLEVYYRHLPIYSGYRAVAGAAPTMDPDAKPAPKAPDEKPSVPADGKPTPQPAGKTTPPVAKQPDAAP